MSQPRTSPFRVYGYGLMSSARVRKAIGGVDGTRLTIAIEWDLFEELKNLALKRRKSISAIGREALRIGVHGSKAK